MAEVIQENGQVQGQGPNRARDPYYLHPNENPGTILVNSHLTGRGNYHLWARAMRMALKSKNKLQFVDCTIRKPQENDPLFDTWDQCNTMVLAWICNTLSPEIYQSILWIEIAADLWRDLRRRYHQGDLYRIATLQESLYALKQGDLSITKYFTQLKIVWEELDNFQPIPSCDCVGACRCGLGVVRGYKEKEYVIRFVRGLNDVYSGVRSQIMLMEPTPDIDKVLSLLLQEEQQCCPDQIEPKAFAIVSLGNYSLIVELFLVELSPNTHRPRK